MSDFIESSYVLLKNIYNFSYPFKENERIVWYYDGALRNVYDEYFPVERTFRTIGKKCRTLEYWTGRETTGGYAWCINLRTGRGSWVEKITSFRSSGFSFKS